ncbi:unnamed protein product [Cyprideis torosa]|uniref:Uncharacterized protein n=1 Tax=Cyprideis torosa TaxID=163714 RepID=A0A7R8W9S5_9CRUS|nr:unnamed protein product [Cyprideis torosa]CAG0884604.1 unnamed protein product [Cyprideis torosa]
MVDADTVQTLSIKGLSIPDDQRSAYSIEAPVTPPPSYMKVTSSSKLKIVKILAATSILLTLLVGSFILGGIYLNRSRECDCDKTPVNDEFVPETRLAFLKEAPPSVQIAGAFSSQDQKAEPVEPKVEVEESKDEDVKESKEKDKKSRKNSRKNRKEERKQKRMQRERIERQRERLQPPPSQDLEAPEPISIFQRLNLPNLLRQLEEATDHMAERIMEQNRRNRIACIMEKRREMMMNDSPFGRRGGPPFMDEDDDLPDRHLILAPGGNGLIDCDEILGDFNPSPPHHPPFARAMRSRTVTLPIMAIVSRKQPSPPMMQDEDSMPNLPNFPPVPSPFNQPPPSAPRNDFIPRRMFQNSESDGPPMDRPNFEGETVPNFQGSSPSSPPIIYRHPLHGDSSPSNSMMHPILRLPRK